MSDKYYIVINHFSYGGKSYAPGDSIALPRRDAEHMIRRRKPLIKSQQRYQTKNVVPAQSDLSVQHVGGPMFAIMRNGQEVERVKGKKEADERKAELANA